MEIKFFSDIFDAIEKAIKSIKAIVNLPKEKRDELRQTLDDTFKLLDTTINMIIIRLGEILRMQDDNAFKSEVTQLYDPPSWTQAEREFRLCKSLRFALSETDRLGNKILKKKVSTIGMK